MSETETQEYDFLGEGLERVYECDECDYRIAAEPRGRTIQVSRLRCVDCDSTLGMSIETPGDRKQIRQEAGEAFDTWGPDPNP